MSSRRSIQLKVSELRIMEFMLKDKVALIGQNGTGKTTLFRDIFKGNNKAIHVNEHVNLAYLSQLQGEILNEDNSILEVCCDNLKRDEIKELLTLLEDINY